QYSLALTYCKLRCARLPFKKLANVLEMRDERRNESPDLSMLPEAERPVVARALSAAPARRYPSCRAFVEALAAAARETRHPTASAVAAAPVALMPAVRVVVVEPGRESVPVSVRVQRGGCSERLWVRCDRLPQGVAATRCSLPPNADRAVV